MASVQITEFTDPTCPWAFSAEPFRRRLDWLYGEELEWLPRMVGLAETPQDPLDKGFTPEKQAAAFERIAKEHGMPIDTRERPRMTASVPACRAVVAARLNAPDRERTLLRRLRVRHFSGDLIDERETLDAAARETGIESDELAAWMEQDDVEAVLREDMAAAREPIVAARVLDAKLANWSGGRRYTCPSYEILRLEDGVRIAVPGFQPFPVYDVILANLVPNVERREPPGSAEEVLRWTGAQLASKEVAVVCDVSVEHAREDLCRVADEEHVGFDGFWTARA